MRRILFSLFSPILIGVLLFLILFVVRVNAAPTGTIATPANFKVAFIGDSGAGNNFNQVLNLIKQEGAQLVLHQGDFGYGTPASGWTAVVNQQIGSVFPYLGSDGNHENWADYAPFFQNQVTTHNIPVAFGSVASGNYGAEYRGLYMVFNNKEQADSLFPQKALANDNHIWKICSWHENRNDFQAGGKSDSVALETYQGCINAGAIVATGHEHSYSRTYSLSDLNAPRHGVFGQPGVMEVAKGNPGKSFVFVSGMGGNGIRDYVDSMHDDDGWWATIYTGNQTTGGSNRYCKNTCTKADLSGQDKTRDIASYNYTFGALFITFNVDGNPYKARGYFKNVAGQVIDEFEIYAEGGGGTPPPSASPTVGATNTPAPTNPNCGPLGDINCDGQVKFDDLTTLINAYATIHQMADLDKSGIVAIFDLSLLLKNYQGGGTGGVPTPTPTLPSAQTGDLSIAVCDPGAGPFSLTIDNPFFPLPVGQVRVLEDPGGFKVQISVLNQTEVVAGVTTRVVEEREWQNNNLIEISRNWFVQAPDKTVCYYGEDVDMYQNGQIVSHSGAWRAGVGQNKPGIIMPGIPAVGQKYQQEIAPGVAMDRAEHMSMGGTFTTPAGTFTDVMLVQETPPSTKRYQRNVGLIYDDGALLVPPL